MKESKQLDKVIREKLGDRERHRTRKRENKGGRDK